MLAVVRVACAVRGGVVAVCHGRKGCWWRVVVLEVRRARIIVVDPGGGDRKSVVAIPRPRGQPWRESPFRGFVTSRCSCSTAQSRGMPDSSCPRFLMIAGEWWQSQIVVVVVSSVVVSCE